MWNNIWAGNLKRRVTSTEPWTRDSDGRSTIIRMGWLRGDGVGVAGPGGSGGGCVVNWLAEVGIVIAQRRQTLFLGGGRTKMSTQSAPVVVSLQACEARAIGGQPHGVLTVDLVLCGAMQVKKSQ